jgi:hypothetical protein
MKWGTPKINEAVDIDRVVLTLPIKKQTIKTDDIVK